MYKEYENKRTLDSFHTSLHRLLLSPAVMRSGWCNIRRRGSVLALSVDSVVVMAQRMLAKTGLSEKPFGDWVAGGGGVTTAPFER